jgi:hypothetical protein
MPDISMCLNSTCPKKETCYRYMAEPDKGQSYSSFSCVDGECEYYWPDLRNTEVEEKP